MAPAEKSATAEEHRPSLRDLVGYHELSLDAAEHSRNRESNRSRPLNKAWSLEDGHSILPNSSPHGHSKNRAELSLCIIEPTLS